MELPTGLSMGGASLFIAVLTAHELDEVQKVQLVEACRAKDRLDKLDELLRGDIETWASLTHRLLTQDYELKIDVALSQANSTANMMKQLLASLRLPDKATGKRPQVRSTRGVYTPAKVSSLERARAAKTS